MSKPGIPVYMKIEGMDCANCALGITRKLSKSGHSDIKVDFASGDASLILNPEKNLDQAIADVESLGYQVIRESEIQKPGRFSATEKKFWFCLLFTLPLFISHMFLPHDAALNSPWFQLALCTPVYLVGLFHFGKSAWGSLKSGVPNMDVLIFIGSTAAYGYSLFYFITDFQAPMLHEHLFFETAATIITLVLLGNLIEHRSVKATTTAISALQQLKPEKAHRITTHDNHEHIDNIPAEQLKLDDLVQVNTGESIPADGVLISGVAELDESMLTGESRPVAKETGAQVITGTLVISGSLRFRVEHTGSETALARIIELVKNAQFEKAPVQRLADKISAIFVPIVLGLAILTFLLGHFAFDLPWTKALLNSIAVLVISCPCAMGLATPTAVAVGVGRAARQGILLRGASTLEELAGIQKVVFDKTGTLTTGRFRIGALEVSGTWTKAEVKAIVLTLEQFSAHPIAQSLTHELKQEGIVADTRFQSVREERGVGLHATDQSGKIWTLGSWRTNKKRDQAHDLYLMCDNELVATIDLQDEIRPDAKALIDFLKEKNIQPVLLSGDRKAPCDQVAKVLGITEVYAEQLPGQKAERLIEWTKTTKTAMIGDGINDAPALARAHVGVSVSDATQIAMQSAQVILLGDTQHGGLLKLKEALLIGKHSLKTIKQNLFWAFFYNVIAIPVAGMGFLSPMIAALTMAFSDVIVIGNSIRLRFKKLI